MSVSAIIGSQITTKHITASTFADSRSNAVSLSGMDDVALQLSASSTPPITIEAFMEVPLVSGAATIDLTALTDSNGVAVNLNAKKIVAIKVRSKTGNTHFMQVATGASNGYGNGGAFSIPLPAPPAAPAIAPWSETYFGPNGVAVDGTHKTLDVTGNGTEVLQLAIIAGT